MLKIQLTQDVCCQGSLDICWEGCGMLKIPLADTRCMLSGLSEHMLGGVWNAENPLG